MDMLSGKMKDAHETVELNKKLCTNIQRNLGALGDILSSVGNNTEVRMYGALQNLEKALEVVLNLSKNYQEKPTVCHHLEAEQKNKMPQDANQNTMNTIAVPGFGMKLHRPAPSMVISTSSSDTAMKDEGKKGNGKYERKESGGEKWGGNKDVEKETTAKRNKEIEKGKKNKDTQNNIEKRGENEDLDKIIEDERRKKENVKGKKNKHTTPKNFEGKTEGYNSVISTTSPDRATKDGEKKGNGKCERKESGGEKWGGNKDVEKETSAKRNKEIEKGVKNKNIHNDIEKRGENEDLDKKIDDERRKKENVKGNKKKHTTLENVVGKTEDYSYAISTSSSDTVMNDKKKGENGKCERKEADQEKRRGKKVLEEKTGVERKKEKHTQNDREKRRENENLAEKIDDERKIENEKGEKKNETRDNVKEKRDGPGLVRPNHASDEDPYDSLRKEEKGWYYSCSSSYNDSQLEAMIKDLSENDKLQQDSDSISYKAFQVQLRDGAPARAHRFGRGEAIALAENEIQIRGMENIEHIHILKLLGYAYHGGFFYMVEDYSIRSLKDLIHDNPSKGKELSWQQCSKIILCIAEGAAVIHTSLHPGGTIKIVPKCVSKISFLFTYETLTQSVQEGVVTCKKMERRFVPLEYKRRHGRFYVKTDVYSYGVLLLELITEQMYIESSTSCKSLATWVLQHALENNFEKCITPRFANGPHINDIKRCVCIALRCVAENPAERPTMGDVDRWLRNKNQVAPWICKLDHNTKDTVTEGGMDTPATTTPMPTDPEGSTGPRLRAARKSKKAAPQPTGY